MGQSDVMGFVNRLVAVIGSAVLVLQSSLKLSLMLLVSTSVKPDLAHHASISLCARVEILQSTDLDYLKDEVRTAP